MSQARVHVAAEPNLVEALSESLRRAGFEVSAYRTVEELTGATAAERPAVVVLASRLADGDAAAALQALCDRVTPAPPAVLVIPADEAARRGEYLAAGFADVLVAPFRPAALATRLVEMTGAKLRLEARAPIALPLELAVEGAVLRGTAFDLSEGGAGVLLDREVQPRALCTATLLPRTGAPLRLHARVAYCRPDDDPKTGRFKAGLKLVALTREEESALVGLMRAGAAAAKAAEETPSLARAAELAAAMRAAGTAPAPPPARRRALPVAAAGGLALVALVAVLASRRPAPLPLGVAALEQSGGIAVVRLADDAATERLASLANDLRARGLATVLVLDSLRRPLHVLDLRGDRSLRCGEPAR